jgi:flagellin
MAIIDSALTTIDTQRATLGAAQSRLDSVVSNLSNVAENSAAAKSRIMDADFAAETAALAKNQILQQAGISVLAQANAQPQNVLALLQ